MKLLVAGGDGLFRRLLKKALTRYDIVTTEDAAEVWAALLRKDAATAILDWVMPGLSGPHVSK